MKGRLRILAGALLLCAIALPISWWVLLRKPTPPPETASLEVKRNYWRDRVKDDISDIPAYVALGTTEERRGYYTAAVRYLLAARSLGASDKEVSGPLGRALLSLARDDEALVELEKAAKLNPENLDATLNLAGLYVIQDRPETASSLLKNFVSAHANPTPDELQRLAFAQRECGDNVAAKELAERALAADPDNIPAHSIAATACLALKQVEEARKHTERLVTLSGGDASIRYLHGLTLAGLGQEDAAIEQWRKTIEQNPAALDAYERLGETYYKRGDVRAAAPYFDVLARRAPNVFTVSRMAEVYTRLKDRERAAYWRAVQVGLAGDFQAALTLGKIASESKDPEISRRGLLAMAEAYRGLRQKEPYLVTIKQLTAGEGVQDFLLLASAYQELDQHEDRTKALIQAAEKATDSAKPPIYFALSQAYSVRGMRDEAEKALEEAIRLDPKRAAYHRELAKTYYERRALDGRLQKAIRFWETALALDDSEASDWQNLGVAYSEAGETAKAAAALEHAIDLEPGSGPTYRELGRVSAKLGDKDSVQRYNALYAKFVTFDQQRQILRTRANRPGASAADFLAYGDFLVKMAALPDAASQYERALALTPQDKKLRDKLASLYVRLRQPEKQAAILAGGGM